VKTGRRLAAWLVFGLPLPVVLAALCLGPTAALSPFKAAALLSSGAAEGPDALARTVLLDVRLPRVLLAFLAGAGLSASGAGLQAVFRNPLADPYVLGLASGAAFGAALAMATSLLPVTASAFLFGLAAAGLSVLLARRGGSVSTVTLILAGVVVSGVFTAGLTLVQFMSDPFRLQTIVHWTMGNLHNAEWGKVRAAAGPVAAGSAGLALLAWRLNVLAMGDEEARTAGLHPGRTRLLALVLATLAASAAVAAAGVIGFVGLVVPHAVRFLGGPDLRWTVPASLFFGGTLLVTVDTLSRTAMAFEIPIGVFTVLIGAPFFVALMRKAGIGWEN
jgi:iron complex transport system permease protein